MKLTILLIAALAFQDTDRQAISPVENEYLSPRLRLAMEEVIRFDRRLLDLAILDAHGLITPPHHLEESSEAAQFLIDGEEDLFPGRMGFAFGDYTPMFDQYLECGRHNLGLHAAKRLADEDPSIGTDELLRTLDERFLSGEPVVLTQRALRLHEFASAQARLAPLGNGSIAYVAWGFLHLDEYWADKIDQRESFITELIEIGASSQACGMAVMRILQPPLKPGTNESGRGIAAYLHDLRAKVGFTHAHRKLLEELVELVDATTKETTAGPSPFDARVVTSSTDGVPTETEPSRLGHLRTWAPEVLSWVLYELEPEKSDELMRRSESLESRKAYWIAMANTVPFQVFRELMLEEVRAILEGRDEHPLAARITELNALAEAGALTEEQRSELSSLNFNVTFSRRTLISYIAELFVRLGAASEYESVVSTLAIDLHGLVENEAIAIGNGPKVGIGHQVLSGAWMELSLSSSPDSLTVLDRILQGDLDVPEYGTSWIINSIQVGMLPGAQALLENVIATGTTSQRASAILNSEWIEPKRYAIEIDRLLEDSTDASLSEGDRAAAWNGAIRSLSARNQVGAKALLIKSIQAGQWRGDGKSASWVHVDSYFREWALDQLSSAEKSQFVQQGLLDSALLN